ncbi:hypothetical protein N658DRAFT_352793 [Parathielavia hyrcaniae]|uniref:Uncharacterized protein n=1 Tax=Parathielavia hyrcaniae TaxID=113614 RepID=A0AAN6T294_9PEZI|nr:hypothetical protein N658DRAFT_352793 [Parathielavia hyrcaniae]
MISLRYPCFILLSFVSWAAILTCVLHWPYPRPRSRGGFWGWRDYRTSPFQGSKWVHSFVLSDYVAQHSRRRASYLLIIIPAALGWDTVG